MNSVSWSRCVGQVIASVPNVILLCLLYLSTASIPVAAQVTIRAVMNSDLKIVDPIWTTAYITRNHGYMIYDTLFSADEKFDIKPQMVDKWTVSSNKLLYTFVLRSGLSWHDGKPVTSDDVIASLKRWGARDAMGQKLFSYVKELKTIDAKTLELTLKEPYGLVLQTLGKPSSNVPFIMPKAVAETPASEQISDFTGSGPFIFKKDEWKPGEKAVYIKNPSYRPRAEAPSGLAGGKSVKVDRVEWLAIADPQTAVNALLAGEIDMIEQPPYDLLPLLKKDSNIALINFNPTGFQYFLRFNFLHPPLNDQKIRQAALAALNQEDFLKAVVGDPAYFKSCAAMFVCGTPLASNAGAAFQKSDFAKSKRLLAEAAYDGTPVVLMHSTDLPVLTNLAPVAKDLLEKGGFKVNMISMDWQSLVARRAKRDPPAQGGWGIFLSQWAASDVINPISTAMLTTNGEKAFFGWPTDDVMETLRDQFARETDPAKQKALAERIQSRALEFGTHAWLGQTYQPLAVRTNVSGFVTSPVPAFWNVTKRPR